MKDFGSRTVYQIFPDRFFNGASANDPVPIRKWKEKPSRRSFFGGDILGIIRKLGYLKKLGIGAIYLTPIFEAPSTHKYDTKDYFNIDPNLGTIEEFKELLKRAHELDIKVIIDGVFNHTGDHFWAFEDAAKYGKRSKYWNWYTIFGYPIRRKPLPNYKHAGIYYLPKLRHDNPEVVAYLVDVVCYWTAMGIDGWRFDMPWCIEPGFCRKITQAALKVNKNLLLIGEYWREPLEFLENYPFHGTMDYIFREKTIQLLNSKIQPKEYLNSIAYKFKENEKIMNCWNMLSSHDTPRLLGQLHRNVSKAIVAFTLQFTLPGMPVIYYGDEIGLFGGKDPDCRRTFDWNETHWNRRLWETIKTLIDLRKTSEALSNGDIRIIRTTQNGFTFERFTASESVKILINLKRQKAVVHIQKDQLPLKEYIIL